MLSVDRDRPERKGAESTEAEVEECKQIRIQASQDSYDCCHQFPREKGIKVPLKTLLSAGFSDSLKVY